MEVSTHFVLNIETTTPQVQLGDSARFVAVTSQPYNHEYVWVVDGVEVANGDFASLAHEMPEKGEYSIIAYANGGYCDAIASNIISVEVADFYQVPTAFTPYNGNPKNNIFMKGYKVEIFNRYQQVVFTGSDGWNGEYEGKLADPGTYFYKLWKKDGRVLKGTIELVKF